MRRKRRGLSLLLTLLVLLGATVAARGLLIRPDRQAAPYATAEPVPTTAPTPAPTAGPTAAPETPQPTPTPQAEPTRSYPLVRGYSEKTYRLVSDLVYTYAAKQDAGIAEQLKLLEELKAEDVAMEAQWHEILDYWRYVNNDFAPQAGEIPEGLAEDDSLCVVVLGFQLRPFGSMTEELVGRCETALACLARYPNALLAVTGGGTAVQNPEATEASAMAAWFIEHGVAPERIFREDASVTTAHNAIYTCALLRERAPQVRQLLIVSSDYHLPLGCLLFEEQAILYAYEEGTKPFEVAGWAGWDSRGVQPDSPMMQKTYLWSVADPKY